MAINELIAGGIKLPQFNLPDYGADLAQMAQIQNARNQNALAQYQLGAAQRAEAKDVARTNALMAAGSDEDAIANALLKIGDVTGYSALMKAKEERQKTRLEKNKLTNEIVNQRLNQSRSFLDTLDPNDPNVGPKLKGWHAGNHADEYLGPLLKSFGATTENSMAEIDNAIAGGPAKIEEFLNRSRLAADKFADFMQRQNDVRQITGGVQAGTPPQMGAPSAAAMPASALSTVAPSVAAPPSRINFVKSEIDRFSNVLSNNPSNKLAADRLQALTTEYNQLSAEAGRQATLQQSAKQHEATLEEAKRHNKALENKDPEAVRAYEYAVKQGFKGTYADWVQSNQAKPADIQAYEYALSQGFKGNLQDWIQSKSKQELPADVQSYEYARNQGYKGTYTQWVKDKATWGRAPAQPPAPAPLERAFDTKTNSQVFVDRADIRANPDRYKPLGAEEKLRPIPETINKGLTGNVASISQIDRAIDAVTKNPDSFGIKGNLPQAILNRTDPKGVEARALVTDVGSAKVHDRSGAAVAASEAPRLMPFIPQATDDAATVIKKLKQLKTQIETEQSGILDFYSQEQGYKPSLYHKQKNASDSTTPSAPATRVDIGSLPPKKTIKGVTYVLQPNGNYIEQ